MNFATSQIPDSLHRKALFSAMTAMQRTLIDSAAQNITHNLGALLDYFPDDLPKAKATAGCPAICIDARHTKAALDMAPNKTDVNDADGLAHLAEVAFFRG